MLEEAGVHPDADQIVSRSVDGFTVGTPTSVVMDGRDAMLAVSMNGETLPFTHGFPVRMIVPGLYGYVSATKWLTDIELSTFARTTPTGSTVDGRSRRRSRPSPASTRRAPARR